MQWLCSPLKTKTGLLRRLLLFVLPLLVSPLPAANFVETDVCVYGATSGGVSAAVTAARHGKSVALLSLNSHVGGMSASGLGVTDIGTGNNTAYIGGVSREFYQRVGQKYGSSNLVIWFEPHVAENVFREMLAEVSVPLFTNQLIASVTKAGERLTSITMEDGSVYRAKMFIDTTYEGDLMALAGVAFTVGRESTAVYNESLAGIRPLGGTYAYDPYVIPGNPASGLLPFVQPNSGGNVGEGDHRLQAYNFRLCLTQNATNKIPIAPPANYSEAHYELFRRYIDARIAANGSVSLGELIHIQTIIPNGKTDINANGELSTDFVGHNYTWATNTHAGREIIRQQHEDYIRGLLHFYATSTNVPANLRAESQSWGLAKDEFQDNGGWPWQIYVREARRMVSDYVMIQHNADGRRTAPDPIGLGRYTIDSHGVQRLASGNLTRWEGSIGGTVPYPYGISYRSIIPRAGECENLLCTFALSASHVGFASARMEPVFMITSQSAASAASIAIDHHLPVQQVDYPTLSALLRAQGQILRWEPASLSTNGIILDQGGPGTSYSGGWTAGANAGGWNGDYWHDQSSSKGTKWVRYTPNLPTNGTYEVHLWWVEHSNRATNTPVDVVHANGTNRILLNQRVASGGWFKVLSTNFVSGTSSSVTLRNDNTTPGSYVVADGVRFLPVGNIATPPPAPIVEVVSADATAGEFGTNLGRFSFIRSGNISQPLTVHFSISGSASPGTDYLPLPQSITLSAGAALTNLILTPIPDSLPEGDESVTLTLSSSPAYQLSIVTNAGILLKDQPVDAWRDSHFSPAELLDPATSSDLADPDLDGLPNLLEYALGLDPGAPDGPNPFQASISNNLVTIKHTRLRSAIDVRLQLEHSYDLTSWHWADPLFQVISAVHEVSISRFTLQSFQSTDSSPAYFLRFRAAR